MKKIEEKYSKMQWYLKECFIEDIFYSIIIRKVSDSEQKEKEQF